jgi:hypothetical protein
MVRLVKEPNDRLQALIEEAGLSHKGPARRINDLGASRGIPGLSYDHSSVIRWLKGEQPRSPAPKLAAQVFSLALARPVTADDLGFVENRDMPELGLRFTPSLHDTIETVTTLWRSDVERRQFIINSAFAAGAYASAASGNVCPGDDAAESFVVGVVVAPDDVPADHAGLLLVAGVVGAIEGEVPQRGELRLHAV